MKRVLVTGGTGFIGRYVVDVLIARGYETHVVGRHESNDLPSVVTFWQADLLEAGQARRVVAAARPSHLVHLAWITEAGRYWDDPLNDAWADASIALHDAFAAAGGKRALHAGSCAEYEWGDTALDEDATPIRPASRYGRSKDKVRRAIEERSDAHSAWARIFFLYGPGQGPGRLVADAAAAVVRGLPTPAPLAGDRRDYLYAGDVAEALADVLESEHRGPINIASGEATGLGDLMSLIAMLASRPELARSVSSVPGRRASCIMGSTDRLRRATGFVPRKTLEDGLRRTLDWCQDRVRTG
jgi:nucleoside-diphosphate-sugar epimerase